MVLFVTVFYASYAFGIMLFICELGQRLSNAFVEIDNAIELFRWYLFPLEVKKMLPIVLSAAHRPVVLEFFGSLSGTRGTFKEVGLIVSNSKAIEYA